VAYGARSLGRSVGGNHDVRRSVANSARFLGRSGPAGGDQPAFCSAASTWSRKPFGAGARPKWLEAPWTPTTRTATLRVAAALRALIRHFSGVSRADLPPFGALSVCVAGCPLQGRAELRRPVSAILVGLVWATVAVLPAGAVAVASGSPSSPGAWHRLNPDQSNPAPEHERLTCSEGRSWSCHYDKVAEPGLNLHLDSTVGNFHGGDVTKSWTCPGWFPEDVCDNVTQVVRGNMVFVLPDGSRFSVRQELVVTDVGGSQVLQHHWAQFGFVCPWFRTFDQALAANPFPLPFDGENWPAGDCVFAS